MLTVGLYGVPDPTGTQRTHDHAVAFVREGEVLASLELERVTGRKHDDRLGEHLEALLRPWIVPGEPVRLVQANSFLGATLATPSGSLVLEGPARVELEPRLAPSRLHLSGASAGRCWPIALRRPLPLESWACAGCGAARRGAARAAGGQQTGPRPWGA